MQLLVILLMVISLEACGSLQQMTQGTPTPTSTTTTTSTATPTLTPIPTQTLIPTITPNLTATEQYTDFFSLVQKIYNSGQISTTDGTYKRLEDYSDELAMSYGLRWAATGVMAKNFIVRADFDWQVANEINNSGCGYVFRQYSNEQYDLIALDALHGTILAYAQRVLVGMSGATAVNHFKIGPTKRMKLPKFGNNPYHATFTLVVNDNNVYTYINDEFFTQYRFSKDSIPGSGQLAPMVLTGARNDYGTRCKITNAELWIINQ